MNSKLRATAMILVALMLPGIVNALPGGYRVGALLAFVTLVFLVLRFGQWARRGKLPRLAEGKLGSKALAFVLLGIYCLAAIRSELNGTSLVRAAVFHLFIIISVSSAAIFLAVSNLRERDPRNLIPNVATCLSFALLIFVVLELVLLGLGVHSKVFDESPQAQEDALFLSLIGIHVHRAMLPISSGLVNGSVIPLAGLLMSVLFLRKTRCRLWADFALTPASAVLLALNDTRSVLFAAMASILVHLLFRMRGRKVALLVLLAPLVPPLIVVFAAVVPAEIREFATARYDAYGMFSGREFIWGVAIAKWSGVNLGLQLFGAGLYGQSIMGISEGYANLFTIFSETGADLASLHNSYLQALADIGIVGGLIFVSFMYTLTKRLTILRDRAAGTAFYGARAMLGVITAVAIVGGTEVALSPYFKEGFVLILLLVLTVSMSPSVNAGRTHAIQN